MKRIRAGNIYVNRNQIGAVVGTQPFGGEGLSGTGPKAGGPAYVKRFTQPQIHRISSNSEIEVPMGKVQKALKRLEPSGRKVSLNELRDLAQQQQIQLRDTYDMHVSEMPGPTGETNQLSAHGRGKVLCLGPTAEIATRQAFDALAQQNSVLIVAENGKVIAGQLASKGLPVAGFDGYLSAQSLIELEGFDAVMSQADSSCLAGYRQALAQREGVIMPLIMENDAAERLVLERHLCIDTTAAGGNASLIAAG